MSPAYVAGRAEGIALAIMALLNQAAQIDRYEYPHTTVADIGGFIATNASMGEARILDAIAEAIKAEVNR